MGSPATVQVLRQSDGVVLLLPVNAGLILALAFLFHFLIVGQLTDRVLGSALDSLTCRRRLFGHGIWPVARGIRVVWAIVVICHESSLATARRARAHRRRCNATATAWPVQHRASPIDP